MNAYKRLKESEAKIWQERTNASAWLAGLYVMQAVGACLSKDAQYPKSPLHLFQNDGIQNEERAGLTDEEAAAKANRDLITAQVVHAKSVLEKQSKK